MKPDIADTGKGTPGSRLCLCGARFVGCPSHCVIGMLAAMECCHPPGVLKRGINGTYHHVSEQHLHRCLSEFDFRYNTRKITDGERFVKLIGKVAGKD
jgi:hypothetical protein